MSLYGTFKTNTEQEREGKWFDLQGVINPDGSTPGFRMARMSRSNPTYQAAMEKHGKDLRQALEMDVLTEDMAGPIMRGVFIDTILLDWRNVYDEAGVKLPYSKAEAASLMEDLPDLYMLLVSEAQKLGNFRATKLEEVAKKSPPPSKTHMDNTGT